MFVVARLLPYEVATRVDVPRPEGGKLLSMCLGRRGDSDRLVVRLGLPDDIEVEVEASKTRRFETLQREDHKNFGRQVISLRHRKKVYCIYLPTGQGMGVGLDVFNDEYPWQWMQRLFSGTDRDLEYRVDYEPSVEKRVRALLRPARSTPCT